MVGSCPRQRKLEEVTGSSQDPLKDYCAEDEDE